jgi:hypothetical protein
MRTIFVGLLGVALCAASASAQTYGLGVGAASPDSVVLKIDGKNKTVQLGTGAATPAAEAFLNCLITGRVVKVERTGSTAKLLMLDSSNVADHVREFLQTKTATDPCALGHAAYARALPPAKASAAPDVPSAAAEGKKKLGRRAPEAKVIPGDERERVLGQALAPPRPSTTAARPTTAPAQDSAAPVMQTLPAATVEQPKMATPPAAPPPATSTSPH